MRKFGSDPAGDRTRFALVGGGQANHYTTEAPIDTWEIMKLHIPVARPGIEPGSLCVGSERANRSATVAPKCNGNAEANEATANSHFDECSDGRSSIVGTHHRRSGIVLRCDVLGKGLWKTVVSPRSMLWVSPKYPTRGEGGKQGPNWTNKRFGLGVEGGREPIEHLPTAVQIHHFSFSSNLSLHTWIHLPLLSTLREHHFTDCVRQAAGLSPDVRGYPDFGLIVHLTASSDSRACIKVSATASRVIPHPAAEQASWNEYQGFVHRSPDDDQP
ncbi:hypothetical protein PR048_032835 [Dryococelus australis]|uniref:Uncharacterized protein n=1 Tax=Dryococelus australis TaxID=614101 RepID=A0ABQ9G432_9NEOP|nr:hypothetical protein PR048_032835 [Dryococelus australis]